MTTITVMHGTAYIGLWLSNAKVVWNIETRLLNFS